MLEANASKALTNLEKNSEIALPYGRRDMELCLAVIRIIFNAGSPSTYIMKDDQNSTYG